MTRTEAVKDETRIVQNILDNHFARAIVNVYKGKDEFLKSIGTFWQTGRANNRELSRYLTLFSIQMDQVVSRPRIDGGKQVYITKEVKRGIEGYRFVGKIDRGNFHCKSFIMITPEHVERILADNRILDAKSDYYTDKERKRIYGFA